jgi:predicted component of viral defense system (DUF524 family)
MNFPQALFFQNDSVDLSIFCKEDIQALINDVSSTVLNEVFADFPQEPYAQEDEATLQNFLKYFLFLKLFDFLFSEYNLKITQGEILRNGATYLIPNELGTSRKNQAKLKFFTLCENFSKLGLPPQFKLKKEFQYLINYF